MIYRSRNLLRPLKIRIFLQSDFGYRIVIAPIRTRLRFLIKEREKLLGQNGGQNGNGTSDRIPNNEENQQLDEAEDEEMIQDEEQSVIIESDQEDEKKAGEPIDLDIESNEDDID